MPICKSEITTFLCDLTVICGVKLNGFSNWRVSHVRLGRAVRDTPPSNRMEQLYSGPVVACKLSLWGNSHDILIQFKLQYYCGITEQAQQQLMAAATEYLLPRSSALTSRISVFLQKCFSEAIATGEYI